MSTRTKIMESCIRSRILYSVQAWELTTGELRKIKPIWNGFLRKMVNNGFKRKNVPPEYLKIIKKAKCAKAKYDITKPGDIDCSYVYNKGPSIKDVRL